MHHSFDDCDDLQQRLDRKIRWVACSRRMVSWKKREGVSEMSRVPAVGEVITHFRVNLHEDTYLGVRERRNFAIVQRN